jgi:YVTN family beta-propeller protein
MRASNLCTILPRYECEARLTIEPCERSLDASSKQEPKGFPKHKEVDLRTARWGGRPVFWVELILIGVLLFAEEAAHAKRPFVLATGRRDPRIYAIDLGTALLPSNNNTSNAIVSRSLVGPRRLDGTLLGDPSYITLDPDHRTAYVMNHHGAVNNAEFLQHGGRANIAVMDVRKMIARKHDNTDHALIHNDDAGWFGGTQMVVLPDMIVANCSEGWLTEDGSNRIGFIDKRTGGLKGQVELPLTGPGTRQLTSPCPAWPTPFVSPTPPVPVGLGGMAFLLPDVAAGCWPNPEGLTLGRGSDGKRYLVSGLGGTEEVTVIDLEAALGGARTAEVAPRIPIQTGTFGIAASPDGRFVAAPARESDHRDFEGNTVSIIDVDLARRGLPGAEAARILVGTDDPSAFARPFTVAWTPDGRSIVVANFRTNNASIIDLDRALAHDPGAEVARIALVRPDGLDSRPKGTAVTSDGRYAVISGGARQPPDAPPSGTVFVIDLRTRAQIATVTGVGNDPYGLAVLDAADEDCDD